MITVWSAAHEIVRVAPSKEMKIKRLKSIFHFEQGMSKFLFDMANMEHPRSDCDVFPVLKNCNELSVGFQQFCEILRFINC